MKRALLAFTLLGLCCVPPSDDSSQVHDLRVLAVNFEPPELMAANCDALLNQAGDGGPIDLTAFLAFAKPIEMTWLIQDPLVAPRDIRWDVRACAAQSDLKCENQGEFVTLASGVTQGGELKRFLAPGFTFVDIPPDAGFGSGTPLLLKVGQQDTFRGIGGLRMPIVLHVTAGTEEAYAMKLMVFSCRAFPAMKANLNPNLPGMTYTTSTSRELGLDDGGLWGENELPQFSGKDAGVRFEPLPFTDLQETYVVPSFQLKPLQLTESWKISWHTDLGRINPNETGGTGFDGVEEHHRVFWQPLIAENTEQDVNFWMVVRDGRGGQTWIHRKLHWKP
jgi:hypothetical protein